MSHHIYKISQEKQLAMMLEYQRTGNKDLYARLLIQYDDLILHEIHKCLKWMKHVRCEPMQDLYHHGLIAFDKCISSVKPTEKLCMLPARVVAYVKSELKQQYKYSNRTIFMGDIPVDDIGNDTIECTLDRSAESDIMERQELAEGLPTAQEVLKCEKLTQRERKVLRLVFMKEHKIDAVASMLGLRKDKVKEVVERGIAKLRWYYIDGWRDAIGEPGDVPGAGGASRKGRLRMLKVRKGDGDAKGE